MRCSGHAVSRRNDRNCTLSSYWHGVQPLAWAVAARQQDRQESRAGAAPARFDCSGSDAGHLALLDGGAGVASESGVERTPCADLAASDLHQPAYVGSVRLRWYGHRPDRARVQRAPEPSTPDREQGADYDNTGNSANLIEEGRPSEPVSLLSATAARTHPAVPLPSSIRKERK